MDITLRVADEILTGVLDGAGSRHWCKELKFPEFTERKGVMSCWEALMARVIDHVDVVEDRSEQGKRPLHHRVTRDKIAAAVRVILTKYPHHLCGVLGGYENGNADANTGDALLQCAAIGDIAW